MSIVNRIYRIARARLSGRFSRRRTEDEYHTAWEESSEQARGSRASQNRRSSSEDPRLTGYYANLELPYGADLQQIKEARKRLMRRYHPDLHSNDPNKQRVATELVQGLNRAYEELKKSLE